MFLQLSAWSAEQKVVLGSSACAISPMPLTPLHFACPSRSGIYYHTPEQKAAAEASKAAQNEKLGGKVVTEIEEVS